MGLRLSPRKRVKPLCGTTRFAREGGLTRTKARARGPRARYRPFSKGAASSALSITRALTEWPSGAGVPSACVAAGAMALAKATMAGVSDRRACADVPSDVPSASPARTGALRNGADSPVAFKLLTTRQEHSHCQGECHSPTERVRQIRTPALMQQESAGPRHISELRSGCPGASGEGLHSHITSELTLDAPGKRRHTTVPG